MKLLTVNGDAKTIKGTKKGYLTGILYLSPANTSGYEVCAGRSEGCTQACLAYSGRAGIFATIGEARKRKTLELFSNRAGFIEQLRKDISALVRKASREGLTPCVRLNGTSDLPWLALTLAREFTTVQFYDYSKLPVWRMANVPANMHYTFSLSESNESLAREALSHGLNVAVPFSVKRGHALPETFLGVPVFDADITDLRFLDAERGAIAGLRVKPNKATRAGDACGFVKPALISITSSPVASLSARSNMG